MQPEKQTAEKRELLGGYSGKDSTVMAGSTPTDRTLSTSHRKHKRLAPVVPIFPRTRDFESVADILKQMKLDAESCMRRAFDPVLSQKLDWLETERQHLDEGGPQ